MSTTTETTTLYKDLPEGAVFRFVGTIERVPYGKLFKKCDGLNIEEVRTGKLRQCSSMFAPVDAGFVDDSGTAPAPATATAQTEARFKVGQRVYWNDPDDGLCSKYGVITAIYDENGNGEPEHDPTITLDDETDVLASELSFAAPTPTQGLHSP